MASADMSGATWQFEPRDKAALDLKQFECSELISILKQVPHKQIGGFGDDFTWNKPGYYELVRPFMGQFIEAGTPVHLSRIAYAKMSMYRKDDIHFETGHDKFNRIMHIYHKKLTVQYVTEFLITAFVDSTFMQE